MGALAYLGAVDVVPVAAEEPPVYHPGSPRLLDRVRTAMRTRHMSGRTEEAYVSWIRRYILFHGKRHPATLGAKEVTRFLSSLAETRRVSASTQNQALSALLFLYRNVLGVDLPWLEGLVHANRPTHIPVVLSREEVAAVLSRLSGPGWLMVALLYGAGLRLLECLQLRVKDVDFARGEIVVRRGKGGRERRTVLPAAVRPPLAAHLQHVRGQHKADLAHGAGWVEVAACPRLQVSERGEGVGVAVGVPGDPHLPAPRDRPAPAASLPRVGPPARRPGGGDPRRDREARGVPHVPSLLRDASPRERLRHPDGAGAPRPARRPDDDDLHPRPEPGRPGRGEPGRRGHRAERGGGAEAAGTRPHGAAVYRAGRVIDADGTSSGERRLARVREGSGDAA
jgi:integrase